MRELWKVHPKIILITAYFSNLHLNSLICDHLFGYPYWMKKSSLRLSYFILVLITSKILYFIRIGYAMIIRWTLVFNLLLIFHKVVLFNHFLVARFLNRLMKENKINFDLSPLWIIIDMSLNAFIVIVSFNLQKFPIFDRGLK